MNTENDVTIAMATQPCRWESALNVIYMLLSQCTRFCVCLNGFDSIPSDLPKSHKLVVLLANGKDGNPPDLGCDNKMYWLGDFPGYYATVDDDIIYPPNYIKSLKSGLDKYGKNVIVSYHGHRYFPENGKINVSTKLLFWYKLKHGTEYCHRLGMGVAMCFPTKLGVSKEIFMCEPKNTGDDELMALWAQRNNVPMICLSTYNINLISNDSVGLKNALSCKNSTLWPRQHLLESYLNWKLNKIKPPTKELTIAMASQPHRAMQMLNVVKQLLPYCTRFCIALNNYDSVPAELIELAKTSNKIITILTGDKHNVKDLGNLNKMYWLGDFPGYYATVDDDLNYSGEYIRTLMYNMEIYGDQAICSYHGLQFDVSSGIVDVSSKRILFYNREVPCNTQCLRPGMGTAIMNPQKIGISKHEYLSYKKGYSDDIITSIFAQKHNIKCIVVKHGANEVTSTQYAFQGLYTNKDIQDIRLKQMLAYKNWRYV